MDVAEILPLISRWLHIIAACVLVGGTVFLRFSIVPLWRNDGPNESVFESIRTRWAKLVMLSILFLLVSGLYNAAIKAIGYQLGSTYMMLLSVKIVLAIFVFLMVSLLAGRSKLAVRIRSAGTKWYDVTCLAMLLLVCIAGFMKLSPQTVKVKQEATTVLISTSADNHDSSTGW